MAGKDKKLDENGTSGLDYAIMVGCREDFIGEVLRRYPSLARRRESQPFGPTRCQWSQCKYERNPSGNLGLFPALWMKSLKHKIALYFTRAVSSPRSRSRSLTLLSHSQWQAQRVDRAGLSAAHHAWKMAMSRSSCICCAARPEAWLC